MELEEETTGTEVTNSRLSAETITLHAMNAFSLRPSPEFLLGKEVSD